eukprot:403374700
MENNQDQKNQSLNPSQYRNDQDALQIRLKKLEQDFEKLRAEGPLKSAEYAVSKFSSNIDLYFPKFALLYESFEEFKTTTEDRVEQIQFSMRQSQNISNQMELIKKDIEYFKNRESIHTSSKGSFDQMEEILVKQSSLESTVESMKYKLTNIATTQKIEDLENKLMHDYLSKAQFRDQLLQLEDKFVTDQQYKQILQQLDKLHTWVDASFISKEEYADRKALNDLETDKKLSVKLNIEDFNEEMQAMEEGVDDRLYKVQQTLESFKKQFSKINKDFEITEQDIKFIDEQLNNKCDTSEAQKLWKNFGKYALYDDLKDLYQKAIPEIQKFEHKIIDYNAELEKVQVIVRRFDEIVSDKANKQNIKEVYQHITQYTLNTDFKFIKQQLNEKFNDNQRKIQEVEEMIDILGKNISKDIYAAVRRATLHLSKNTSMQIGGNGGDLENQTGNYSIANEEMKSIIASKVDRQELNEIFQNKSNKKDTELCLRWIEIIHRQIKQISILITEILKFDIEQLQNGQIPTGQGKVADNQVKNGKSFLFNQALSMQQWMNKFDTANINEYYEHGQNSLEPTDIKAFQKYANESLQNVEQLAFSPFNDIMNQNIKVKTRKILNQTSIQNSPRTTGLGTIINNKINFNIMPATTSNHDRSNSLKIKQQNTMNSTYNIGDQILDTVSTPYNFNTFSHTPKRYLKTSLHNKKLSSIDTQNPLMININESFGSPPLMNKSTIKPTSKLTSTNLRQSRINQGSSTAVQSLNSGLNIESQQNTLRQQKRGAIGNSITRDIFNKTAQNFGQLQIPQQFEQIKSFDEESKSTIINNSSTLQTQSDINAFNFQINPVNLPEIYR